MISDQVLVAIIGGQVAVIVALITIGLPLLASTRKHAKTSADQVTNSHDTNLRDDLDEKHSDNAGRLGRVEGAYRGLRTDLNTATRGIRRIEDHLGIEQTQQPNRRKK